MFLLSTLWDELMSQKTFAGVMVVGFLQTLTTLLFIGLIGLLIYLFVTRFKRKVKKALKKVNKFEEKGLYKEAYLQFCKFMDMVETDGKHYYMAGYYCQLGEKSGWNPPDEYASSEYWYKKSAEAGIPLAEFQLAKMEFEKYFPANIIKASDAFKKMKDVADLGAEEAQEYISECTKLVKQKVEEKVINEYHLAIILRDADLIYSIGVSCWNGGLTNLAFDCFSRAHDFGSKDAAYLCGKIYEEGLGNVEKNHKLAMNWYKKAAETGKARHCLYVGNLYLNEDDYESAAECFAIGCDNNDEKDEIRGACAHFAAWAYGELFLQVGKKYNGNMKKCEKDPDFIKYGEKALEYEEKEKKFGYVPSKDSEPEE